LLNKVLEDKTTILFWYKFPDAYLQNPFNDTIDHSLLRGLIRVDIVIRGNRGGCTFVSFYSPIFRCGTAKVPFGFPLVKNVSFLDTTYILPEPHAVLWCLYSARMTMVGIFH